MSHSTPQAKPCGRTLRLFAGTLMTIEGCRHLFDGSSTLVFEVTSVFIALVAFYCALHIVISRRLANVHPWLGAILAVLPVISVYIFSPSPGKLGSVMFVGVSLLLASIRAHGGCEVMTIPGMLFGQRTHLACIIFSPLDWLEDALHRPALSTSNGDDKEPE